MSHARRRSAQLLFTLLTAMVLALGLAAGTAVATEGDDHAEDASDEETSGFGTGDWDGMILAAGVGIVLGVGVFAASDPGSIPKADAHH